MRKRTPETGVGRFRSCLPLEQPNQLSVCLRSIDARATVQAPNIVICHMFYLRTSDTAARRCARHHSFAPSSYSRPRASRWTVNPLDRKRDPLARFRASFWLDAPPKTSPPQLAATRDVYSPIVGNSQSTGPPRSLLISLSSARPRGHILANGGDVGRARTLARPFRGLYRTFI